MLGVDGIMYRVGRKYEKDTAGDGSQAISKDCDGATLELMPFGSMSEQLSAASTDTELARHISSLLIIH